MTSQTILTVGSLNMDQIVRVERLPVMGETLLGTGSLRLVPGGKGANQAVAMARLGATVSMAGRVGQDPFGMHLFSTLQAEQVDVSLLVVDEQEASGSALIFLLPNGDNAIVVAPGANARVGDDPGQMQQIFATLPQARALVLQMEIPSKTVQTLIGAAHQQHVPVVLNLAPAQPLPLDILRQLDVLIVNETEASALRDTLSGASTGSTVIGTPDEAWLLAAHLHSQGIANVVITLGAQGAILAHHGEHGLNETIHVPAPIVRVVDTTAAGDCFVGAFTVALAEGQLPTQALRFAVFASALKVTKFGAQPGLSTRAEVETLLHPASSLNAE